MAQHIGAILRFCKLSTYGHPIFVSTPNIDLKTYNILSNLSVAIERKYPGTYLHVHKKNNSEVIYIQFIKHPTEFGFDKLYAIDFLPLVRKKRVDNSSFVVCKILTVSEEDRDVIFNWRGEDF